MKIFIKNKPTDAWHWILNYGYFAAWKHFGYESIFFNNLKELKNETEYNVMCFDDDIRDFQDIEILGKAKKSFVYVQPTSFPGKFGQNPLFITSCNSKLRRELEKNPNIKLWSFVTPYDEEKIFSGWNKVSNILLAFDDINYMNYVTVPHMKYKYDVCYIGGRANNGFDEKIKLIEATFAEFEKSGLRTGFFINKGLTLANEANILFHSEVGINIHDVFQRLYGYDTNERTFKTLGLTGLLVSDSVRQLEEKFPTVLTSNDPVELTKKTKEIFELSLKERNEIKEKNRALILEKHTYKNRVKELLSL